VVAVVLEDITDVVAVLGEEFSLVVAVVEDITEVIAVVV
jgi:hypothetical protein